MDSSSPRQKSRRPRAPLAYSFEASGSMFVAAGLTSTEAGPRFVATGSALMRQNSPALDKPEVVIGRKRVAGWGSED